MQFKLNEDVKYILEQLNKYGTGFLVGGAIRDMLIGIEPDDYDFATDIPYNDLKRIFLNCDPKEVEPHFGILMITLNGKEYEIAKYRKEIGILNSRYPKTVKFIQNIEDDLARRDFTVNAMAYNDEKGLIDLFDGQNDARKKIIRFVGKAKLRIEEDALRIMRAFRFISKFGFSLDRKTAEAIFDKRKFLNKISKERIFDEISKILLGPYSSKALNEMKKLKILEHIIPEFKYTYTLDHPKAEESVFKHTLKTIELCDVDLITRLAAMFHELGKISTMVIDADGNRSFYNYEKESALIAEEKLRYLKVSNELIFSVKKIILNHSLIYNDIPDKALKKLIIDLDARNFKRLLNLLEADMNSKRKFDKGETEELLKKFIHRIEEIREQGEIPSIRDLDITGIDLINLKFNSVDISKIKNKIYDLVLENTLENKKEEIVKYLLKKYKLADKLEYEKSCGALIYNPENKEFLIVKMHNGNWGFAKGHTEHGENEKQTAIREVKEETGLDIKIISDFKAEITYVPRENILKKVSFFLGYTNGENLKIDDSEIEDYSWLNYENTLKLLTYRLQKEVLEKAKKFINLQNSDFKK